MKGKNPSTFTHEKEKQNVKCGFERRYLKSRRLGRINSRRDSEGKYAKYFLKIFI
jgi:hypothetical protein